MDSKPIHKFGEARKSAFVTPPLKLLCCIFSLHSRPIPLIFTLAGYIKMFGFSDLKLRLHVYKRSTLIEKAVD